MVFSTLRRLLRWRYILSRASVRSKCSTTPRVRCSSEQAYTADLSWLALSVISLTFMENLGIAEIFGSIQTLHIWWKIRERSVLVNSFNFLIFWSIAFFYLRFENATLLYIWRHSKYCSQNGIYITAYENSGIYRIMIYESRCLQSRNYRRCLPRSFR